MKFVLALVFFVAIFYVSEAQDETVVLLKNASDGVEKLLKFLGHDPSGISARSSRPSKKLLVDLKFLEKYDPALGKRIQNLYNVGPNSNTGKKGYAHQGICCTDGQVRRMAAILEDIFNIKLNGADKNVIRQAIHMKHFEHLVIYLFQTHRRKIKPNFKNVMKIVNAYLEAIPT